MRFPHPLSRRAFHVLLLLASGARCSLPAATPPEGAAAAHAWLIAQTTPSGLVTSFQAGNLAFTYDEAVAAIAFTIRGDPTRARAILAALRSLQGFNGALFNSYHVATLNGFETDQHVGPNLWVVMAAAYYAKITGDRSFDPMAQRILDWAQPFQQADGGFNGGLAANGTVLPWASTEHNLDALAAYRAFGRTTVEARVRDFLDRVVWDAPAGRFFTGRGDSSVHLDVNTWGVLALGAAGTRDYAAGLAFNETLMRTTQTGPRGTLTGFDFDAAPVNDVWLEGTAQSVSAYTLAGDSAKRDFFLAQLLSNQDAAGGLQYSLKGTHNGFWTMETANAVSTAGWLIMAVAEVNPFQALVTAGAGSQVNFNTVHPNGNIFDQILLTGPTVTFGADAGQVTRASFIDLNDDIVQLEFSGAGTVQLTLEEVTGPAGPLKYSQAVNYMKGHAVIAITGADETTNLSLTSVGRLTAFDPTGAWNLAQPASDTNNPLNNGNPIFRATETYDGIADVALVTITSPTGRFGGVRMAGAAFSRSAGRTGLDAAGIEFTGRVLLHDLMATGAATPVLLTGAVGTAEADPNFRGKLNVAGSDLAQPNGQPVQIGGLEKVRFIANRDSHFVLLPARHNAAVFTRGGADVTAAVVENPTP